MHFICSDFIRHEGKLKLNKIVIIMNKIKEIHFCQTASNKGSENFITPTWHHQIPGIV